MAEKEKLLEAVKKQQLIQAAAKKVGKEISSEREKSQTQTAPPVSERR